LDPKGGAKILPRGIAPAAPAFFGFFGAEFGIAGEPGKG
jgi:hypothetical protein